MFSAGGTGRAALQRVLHAYAIFDSEVGYCQGMGFIVGLFLSYMPEKVRIAYNLSQLGLPFLCSLRSSCLCPS